MASLLWPTTTPNLFLHIVSCCLNRILSKTLTDHAFDIWRVFVVIRCDSHIQILFWKFINTPSTCSLDCNAFTRITFCANRAISEHFVWRKPYWQLDKTKYFSRNSESLTCLSFSKTLQNMCNIDTGRQLYKQIMSPFLNNTVFSRLHVYRKPSFLKESL